MALTLTQNAYRYLRLFNYRYLLKFGKNESYPEEGLRSWRNEFLTFETL